MTSNDAKHMDSTCDSDNWYVDADRLREFDRWLVISASGVVHEDELPRWLTEPVASVSKD
jgi:hypothetical protein